jgi:hypothetical protein
VSQKRYDRLTRLAGEAGFPHAEFSAAEKKLFGSLAFGDKNDCAEDPKDQRTIRSEIFEWIFNDREAVEQFDRRGLRIKHAIFRHRIDLDYARIGVPLALEVCDFLQGISLKESRTRRLSFSGSTAHSGQSDCAVCADGAVIDGSLFFTANFTSYGEIRLVGTRIGGGLVMSSAKLKNMNGDAFSADSAYIEGDVFLHEGFSAEGDVRFVGATIRGSLCLFNDSRLDEDAPLASVSGQMNLRNATVGIVHDFPQPHLIKADPLSESRSIALDGFTYTAIGGCSPTDACFRKRWLRIGTSSDGHLAPQPYTQLAKVLRDMGHPGEARKILIEREHRLVEEGQLDRADYAFRRLVHGKLLGYGYRPWQVLYPLLVTLLLGWWVFYTGWSAGKFNPESIRVYTAYRGEGANEQQRFPRPYAELHDKLPEYPEFHSFVYSLDTLLPIVDLHQESYWLPTEGYLTYLWWHIALGWVFTTLLVAGLAGVVRRPAD